VRRYRVLRDPALTRYVALVGSAVAAVTRRPDPRYYFVVLDAPEVNAFAAPGGYVFVTRGTFALVLPPAPGRPRRPQG
jgi:predicted Zn-dependent protease